jgi:hypothetical protein
VRERQQVGADTALEPVTIVFCMYLQALDMREVLRLSM